MANLKKTLESGAEIEIQVASFEKSHRLLQAVKASMIPMDDLISIIVCPSVQAVLWDCMGVCLYNGIKVTRDTFEPEAARGDYLIIAKEALVANLAPFFRSLGSPLSADLPGQGSSAQG